MTNVSSITIPDSMFSIGSYVFQNTTKLESIVIPFSVQVMGHHVFTSNVNLIVYVENPIEPLDWLPSWDYSVDEVVWGYVE